MSILDRHIQQLIIENSRELSSIGGNLLSAASKKDIKTLLVTSSHPQEGKTISAVSMAYTLSSQVNSRVVLVDANFRSPKIHELFNETSTPGLSDMLLSDTSLNDTLVKTEYENLMLVPCGSSLSKDVDVRETEMFKSTLNAMKERFDYVIVDSCSVFGSSDISLIAKLFDGVILVIECENTRWEVVQQAKETINNVGGVVLGTVLNKRRYYIPKKLYGKV
jgi:capsular exopolysaccharide synthesis family protein